MEISCKHHKTSWLLLFPLTRAIGTTFLMYYIRNRMVMVPHYRTFSKFSPYWPQISIKEYGCQSPSQRITFVTIQHFCRSGGPMWAENFEFKNFHLHLKPVGPHTFLIGAHMFSAVDTLTNLAYRQLGQSRSAGQIRSFSFIFNTIMR